MLRAILSTAITHPPVVGLTSHWGSDLQVSRTKRMHQRQRTPLPAVRPRPLGGLLQECGRGAKLTAVLLLSLTPAQLVAEQTLKSRGLCDSSRPPNTSQGGFLASCL